MNGLNPNQEMVKRKASIVVFFTMPGFHHYPEAPEDVAFLRDRHRHLFHFRLYFRVSHHNRDLEFFQQAQKVKQLLRSEFGEPCEFENCSCEMVADWFLDRFQSEGCFKVEVSEDGENGSVVEIEREEPGDCS